jgi:cathepsin F
LLVLSLAASQAIDKTDKDLFQQYQKFMQQFSKTYKTFDEMNKRYEIFTSNLNRTSSNNTKYKTGVTKFMDLTPEDFKRKYLTLNRTQLKNLNHTQTWYNASKTGNGRFLQSQTNVPESFDWALRGAVNEIQNQGECGGCWAFSTVANLEGVYFIKYGTLPKYSEQQLIDCDPTNSGCGGGIMGNAYDYISQNGIQSEIAYPYQNAQGYCQFDPSQAANIVSTWTSAGTEDEDQIKEFLYTTGPLAVTINAENLQYYTGGVLSQNDGYCSPEQNHGVNIVGYGTDEYGTPYWKVRNTWGTDWGEQGYFRIQRGVGLCGINGYVVSAVLN